MDDDFEVIKEEDFPVTKEENEGEVIELKGKEYRLTTRGMVVGSILCNGQLNLGELLDHLPGEDPDDIDTALKECLERGFLKQDMETKIISFGKL